MKKVVSLIVILAAAGAGWWFVTNQGAQPRSTTNSPQLPGATVTTEEKGGTTAPTGSREAIVNAANQGVSAGEAPDEVKPAAQAFTSAEEAFAAVVKGAKDFDDSVLEQFTEPGADCTWCPAFYASVQELALNPNTPQDQKSYMAEVLAISGRPDNIQTLVEAIKNAPNSTEADLFAEALELTLGKEDVTKVLGEQLSTTNDTLREASVAAITNQGTRYAAELLQTHVRERNDPDAYYSVGIGPGEFIPDEEALPFVQEQVQKRDQYSAVWAKALINAGLPGLQSLFEQLENSTNGEADRTLIKDALAHVNFEDGIKEMTDNIIANNRSPVAVDFARQIQAEIKDQETEEAEGTTEP